MCRRNPFCFVFNVFNQSDVRVWDRNRYGTGILLSVGLYFNFCHKYSIRCCIFILREMSLEQETNPFLLFPSFPRTNFAMKRQFSTRIVEVAMPVFYVTTSRVNFSLDAKYYILNAFVKCVEVRINLYIHIFQVHRIQRRQ